MPTAREAIQRLLNEGITDRKTVVDKVAKDTGLSRDHVSDTFSKIAPHARGIPTQRQEVRKVKASTLVEQERLDHVKIIRETLDKFGPEDCAYDDTLWRDLGIPSDRWRELRNLEEFKEYQVMLPNRKRVWCLPIRRVELLRLSGVREV